MSRSACWLAMLGLLALSGCASTIQNTISGVCVQQCRQTYPSAQDQIACINRCEGR